jgi:hypothetical protein
VAFVRKKVLPVAFAEDGFGITLLKARFASSEFSFEFEHPINMLEAIIVRTILAVVDADLIVISSGYGTKIGIFKIEKSPFI